jgi:hypothetical protein
MHTTAAMSATAATSTAATSTATTSDSLSSANAREDLFFFI